MKISEDAGFGCRERILRGDRIAGGYRWFDKIYDILKLITAIEEILSAPAAKA